MAATGRRPSQLPDLRGRAPLHVGGGFTLGERAGEEAHTLTQSEIPSHTHLIQASSQTGDQPIPSILASVDNVYRTVDSVTTIRPETLASVGGSQAHENRHPLLTLNWCIALIGIFPESELSHGPALRRRDQDVRGQLRPCRLDALPGPAAADLRVRNAVRPDRHDLRGRRPVDLRPARPAAAGCRCTRGRGPGLRTTSSARRRRRGSDAEHAADPEPHPRDDRLDGPRRQRQPAGQHPRLAARVKLFLHEKPELAMSANMVSPVGGSQPHDNRMPVLTINYIISLFGIFPSQ